MKKWKARKENIFVDFLEKEIVINANLKWITYRGSLCWTNKKFSLILYWEVKKKQSRKMFILKKKKSSTFSWKKHCNMETAISKKNVNSNQNWSPLQLSNEKEIEDEIYARPSSIVPSEFFSDYFYFLITIKIPTEFLASSVLESLCIFLPFNIHGVSSKKTKQKRTNTSKPSRFERRKTCRE